MAETQAKRINKKLIGSKGGKGGKGGKFVALLLGLALALGTVTPVAADGPPDTEAGLASEVAQHVRDHRASVCPGNANNAIRFYRLDDLAQWRTEDMTAHAPNWYDHDIYPGGLGFTDYLDNYNVYNWSLAGENVGRSWWDDGTAADRIFVSWLNSTPHRNVLDDCRYDAFGVGVNIEQPGDSPEPARVFTLIMTDQLERKVMTSTGYSYIRQTASSTGTIVGRVNNYNRLIVFKTYSSGTWYWVWSPVGYGYIQASHTVAYP